MKYSCPDVQIGVNALVFNLFCLILVPLWTEDKEVKPGPL